MGEKKPRPWWHASLAYATFSWLFTGGIACIQPVYPILLPTWLVATVAVAWYAFCVGFFLRRDDPSRAKSGGS